MNTFMNNLERNANFTQTTNGALAHKTTLSSVMDMFAMGGAMRNNSENDIILMFKNAFEENEDLTLKCLFYLGDIRRGQGERRFFKICLKWLADHHPNKMRKLVQYIPEYSRWDTLYTFFDTKCEKDALYVIRKQLKEDLKSKTPSLLGKWLKSENASSAETKRLARKTRHFLNMTSKQYRVMLTSLREKINVLENLMSHNRWDEIEFGMIPSKAGLNYANCFCNRNETAERYKEYIENKKTKVNAGTLYPYEIVEKAIKLSYDYKPKDTDIMAVEKFWDNQIDYLEGADCKMMCVCDTSGSMHGRPINIAIGLSMYCAERLRGPFKDHYISFSSRPKLIKIEGTNFVDKVSRIYKTNLCENTNIEAAFDLLLKTALKSRQEDIPETLVIISDMQIDRMTKTGSWLYEDVPGMKTWTQETAATEMEIIRKKWEAFDLKMPKLIYWNVNATKPTILDAGENVSFVSGCSPILFKQILSGKNGYELMIETICSDRYAKIHA